MSSTKSVQCQVPSKLILCGEHAVLYGSPALSVAINLPTLCKIEWQALPIGHGCELLIDLPDLQHIRRYTSRQWQDQMLEIELRFSEFHQPSSATKNAILLDPTQLIIVCMAQLNRWHPLTEGLWHIRIHSENWLKRGMGSSAAVILATLKAAAAQLALPLKEAQLLKLASTIENYQHGRSSGLDPATLLAKDVIEFHAPNSIHRLGLKLFPLPAWLIDTGEAQSSTADCVKQVQQNFADDNALWQNFTKVVRQIKHAWQAQTVNEFTAGIRQNQQLLEHIGVVPTKVQALIKRLNQLEPPFACAKVCGAGSVSGDAAGVVIYFGYHAPTKLCHEMGYKLLALSLYDSTQGT
ncbi:mevalonate kinase [Thiosulfatimonas sediminis]|uniref:Mevalonate kinase n=1 Tax=Thiosulfatimonas sediminis TaxID=2675054 RepID=A0A6F8PWS0_9GAMM|nr:hypothetical protein [Thiosulfatimonas sediminis]BBP46593.1 mevalonate kinase [Thiosulfatimonas sediminis]